MPSLSFGDARGPSLSFGDARGPPSKGRVLWAPQNMEPRRAPTCQSASLGTSPPPAPPHQGRHLDVCVSVCVVHPPG